MFPHHRSLHLNLPLASGTQECLRCPLFLSCLPTPLLPQAPLGAAMFTSCDTSSQLIGQSGGLAQGQPIDRLVNET